MKFLHTGDLHIGQTLRKISRVKEHTAMLAWLEKVIREEKIEVLLIAGDVFETSDPSVQSQTIFFNFLARIEEISDLGTVIITAGNHDSAARMKAWCPVTKKLGIHIVGAASNKGKDWLDWIIPIQDSAGEVCVAVNAIPFLSEFRLGIRWNSNAVVDKETLFKEELSAVYREMAEKARDRYGDVPLIGMGHLTAMDENYDVGEFPRLVHMIIKNGLDGKVFGKQYSYVALGHIHRKYKVRGAANAWYCGSVVPCSIAEAEDGSRRGVWIFDIDGNKDSRPEPTEIVAPCFRQLVRWIGTDKEVESFLREFSWEEDCSPIVYLEVETDSARKVDKLVNEVLAELNPRPYVVEVKSKLSQQRKAAKSTEHEVTDPEALTRPMELFQAFHKYKEGVEVDEKMLQLFKTLVNTENGEDDQ